MRKPTKKAKAKKPGKAKRSVMAGMLDCAISEIDARFGRGYAQSHPAFLSDWLQCQSRQRAATETAKSVEEIARAIRIMANADGLFLQ